MDKNPDSRVITKWLSEEHVSARALARHLHLAPVQVSNLRSVEGIASSEKHPSRNDMKGIES